MGLIAKGAEWFEADHAWVQWDGFDWHDGENAPPRRTIPLTIPQTESPAA